MVETLALSIVVLTAMYFIALGVASLLVPLRAGSFLLGFAGSLLLHYVELIFRFVVGGALLLAAPRMVFSGVFRVFGWVLVVTTCGLMLIPWQWHRRFTERAVPSANRYISLVGLASLALGGFLLTGVVRGIAS